MLLTGRNPFPGRSKEEVKKLIVNKPVDLEKPIFKHVSALAKDFITKCLTKEQDKRWSADQLLHHQWMVDQTKANEIPLDNETRKDIMDNL